MYYAFLAAAWFRPSLKNPLPSSTVRRVIGATQPAALLFALLPGVPAVARCHGARPGAGAAGLFIRAGRRRAGTAPACRPLQSAAGSPASRRRYAGGDLTRCGPRREVHCRRALDDGAVRGKPRAVAGAVPRRVVRVELDRAAQMRADGRDGVEVPGSVSVDGGHCRRRSPRRCLRRVAARRRPIVLFARQFRFGCSGSACVRLRRPPPAWPAGEVRLVSNTAAQGLCRPDRVSARISAAAVPLVRPHLRRPVITWRCAAVGDKVPA